jgi:uncharacterized membrane protein YagU involved in acid resistance
MQRKFIKGVIPGIMAGYLFLAYAGGGMQDMIGGMIDSNDFMGFILHIVFSAIIGGVYVTFFTSIVKMGNPLLNIVIGGLIYGLLWWVVGANFIMPLIAGGDVFQFGLGPSFYGHIIFGHALAFLVMLRNLAIANKQ